MGGDGDKKLIEIKLISMYGSDSNVIGHANNLAPEPRCIIRVAHY